MCKIGLLSAQKLAEAKEWAAALVTMESSGPGDVDNAMCRLEERHGISYATFWSLRYRFSKLKEIGAGPHEGLRLAFIADCERHQRRLKQAIDRVRSP